MKSKHVHIYSNFVGNALKYFEDTCREKDYNDKEAYLVDDHSIPSPFTVIDLLNVASYYVENDECSHINHVYIITSLEISREDANIFSDNVDINFLKGK